MEIRLTEESINSKSSEGVYRYKEETQYNIIKISNKSVDTNSSTGIYLYEIIKE